jgi:DNA-binding XRE family transcriptional regulator
MGDNIQMKNYRAPGRAPKLPELDLVRKRPRNYIEWRTLRLWDRLPASERDVPGYLLRLAREKAGMTQKQLAETIETTQQAAAQAERWVSNPSINFMKRWAMACGKRVRVEME